MTVLGVDAFDQWLGQELQGRASAHVPPSPMPVQAEYHAAYVKAAIHVPLLAKVAAVLTTKVAIGATVGVLAVGAAGGEALITGSVNPGDWGKQVVQQVNLCKEALAPGSHGIGKCVSSFASQHGKQESSDHKAKPTPGRGPEHTPGPPPDKVHPSPPVKAHPTPPPTKVHPTPPTKVHRTPPPKKNGK
jgi:hypothetical protein